MNQMWIVYCESFSISEAIVIRSIGPETASNRSLELNPLYPGNNIHISKIGIYSRDSGYMKREEPYPGVLA
jgi:hypothetical protein